MELAEQYRPVFAVHLGRQKTTVLTGYEAVREALVGTGQELAGRPPIAIFQLIQGGRGVFSSSGERWRAARQLTMRTLRGLGVGRAPVADKVLQELRCLTAQLDSYGAVRLPGSRVRVPAGPHRQGHGPLGDARPAAVQHLPLARGPPPAAPARPAEGGGGAGHPEEPPGGTAAPRARARARAELPGRPDPAGPGERPQGPVCRGQRGGLCPGHGHGWHGNHVRHTAVGRPPDGQAPERAGPGAGGAGPSAGARAAPPPPRLEDQRSLPYTNTMLHEVQRFITLLPHVPRCTASDTQLDGHLLPKGPLPVLPAWGRLGGRGVRLPTCRPSRGTPVVPLLSSVLLDKTQWETPRRFNPGHFLDADGRFVKRAAFLPFSAGCRVCVRESLARSELFLLFSGLLQRASVARQHLPGTEVPPTCSWGCRQMAGAAGPRDDVHPEASLRPAFPLALCRARPCPGSSGPPADPTPFSEVLGTVLRQHSAPGARPLSPGATTETPLAEDKLVEGQQPPRGRRRGSGGKDPPHEPAPCLCVEVTSPRRSTEGPAGGGWRAGARDVAGG